LAVAAVTLRRRGSIRLRGGGKGADWLAISDHKKGERMTAPIDRTEDYYHTLGWFTRA